MKKSRAQEAREAAENGDVRFVTKVNPCRKCGGLEFYSSGKSTCVQCNKDKYKELTSTDVGKKRWRGYVKKSRAKISATEELSKKAERYAKVKEWRMTERGRKISRESMKQWEKRNQLNLSLRRSLRRMSISLSSKYKNMKDEDVVGYSKSDFDSMLLQSAPSLDAVASGEYHVDHILPISWFIINGIADPKIVNALKNLKAIPKLENLSKGSKWLMDGVSEWDWCYMLQSAVYGEVRYKEGG